MQEEICGYCGGRGFVLGSMFDRWGYQCHIEPPQMTCEYCGGSGQCEDGARLLPAREPENEQHPSAGWPRWA
jgi:hypothetical protein